MDPQEFASRRNELARRSGRLGPERRAALTALTDGWLQGLFDRSVAGSSDPFCLVAVGGYGRGELTLGSDIDLLLIHRASPVEASRVADAIWYPVWDSGVRLDHSVRTVSEARRLASDDLKVVLGLLDARVIAGDESLGQSVQSTVLADWRAMADRRLAALREIVSERRERFGDAAQLLEPDVKESYGGLRDATILRGVAASWVTDVPHALWLDSVPLLLDVRDAMHRVAGRAQDRLVLQDQDAVAEDLGLGDADVLLRSVSNAARDIAYASDITWHRVERLTRNRAKLTFRPVKRKGPSRLPLAEGVVMQDGEAVLAMEARPDRDQGLVLRCAAAAAQAGLPLSPHAVDRLAREAVMPERPWSRENRESFVSLLGAGSALGPVWESLDRSGILVRLLPEWEVVRSAPQRNSLHTFTVDRHLVEAAVQAGAMTRNVSRPDLLLLSALLHDIGKAREGDHSLVGEVIAISMARGMGFDEDDAKVIGLIARLHLLLPDTATRRDLSDPAVVEAVAAAVGSVEVLDLLHEVTIADSLATGPTVSTEWRFRLIGDLCGRVRDVLAGRSLPMPPPLTEHQQLALDHVGIWTLLDVREHDCVVTVGAPDRLGLLATVAGVLSLNRLNVLAARVLTVDGRAVQEWTVRTAFGDPPSAERLAEDLRRAVEGTLDVAERLAQREADYAPRNALQVPQPMIVFAEGSHATVAEIRAHDAPALLFKVARAIASADATIIGAKVSTLGSDAVDVFFVTTADGRLLSTERQAALRATVLASIA